METEGRRSWTTSSGQKWHRIRFVYSYNDVKLWSRWDHYPTHATRQEADDQKTFIQKKKRKRWAGWRPFHEAARIEYKKTVMEKENTQKEDLETIQKNMRRRQRRSRTPQSPTDDEEVRRTPEKVRMKEGAAARCTKTIKRKVLRKQAWKSQSRSCFEM